MGTSSSKSKKITKNKKARICISTNEEHNNTNHHNNAAIEQEKNRCLLIVHQYIRDIEQTLQTYIIPESIIALCFQYYFYISFILNNNISIDDFSLLNVVGGSFHKVLQVRKNDTGQRYAMKIIKKKTLIKRKSIFRDLSKISRFILGEIDNPFIVSLRFAFQTQTKIYLILDFYKHRELFFYLKNEGRFSLKRSIFYSAEICLGLKCIHSYGIIFGDLKPENIILDNDGHIKIIDSDLEKDSLNGNIIKHIFNGTPEYLAPEILLELGYNNKASDWWSFGTLLYEMLTGLPPFYNENLNVMYEMILQHVPIPLPKYFSEDVRSIVLRLLERQPEKRLGASDKDALEIEQHALYRDIDWDKLYKKEIKIPFKPGYNNEKCIDPEFTEEIPNNPVRPNDAAGDMFTGFVYDEQ